jgi:thioredoxin 1
LLPSYFLFIIAEGLDSLVKSAKSKLVVVDYSTTWCGPCKVVYPKYVELSEKYTDVAFLKCFGDSSSEANLLMKREGIRAVPAFHFWKNGSKQEVINGARIDDVEAAIKSLK